jgi:hypothetical protein
MAIRLINCTSARNGGDGLHVAGDVELEATGFVAEGNGGDGVRVRELGLIEKLGLPFPPTTDPTLLAEVLQQVLGAAPEAKEHVVRSSGLFERLKGTVDGSTLVANVLTIATHPSVADVIKRLLGQS